jgi:hypothetical protein
MAFALPIANADATRRDGRAHSGHGRLRLASLTGARISKVIPHASQLHSYIGIDY